MRDARAETRQWSVAGDSQEEPVRQRIRVLVVEDSLINQRVALGMLKKLGYPADVADNGREALAALERFAYAAVLMDCQMPEMDGFAATAAIRAREGDARRTPIIAMTANAMLGDRERCLDAGMDDYIAKPFRVQDLAAALERWVGPAPPAATAGLAGADGEAEDGSPPVIDEEALAGLVHLGMDLVADVLVPFRRDSAQRLPQLDEAARRADSESLSRVAHALKGDAVVVGAVELQGLCVQLERLGREGRVAEAAALLEAVREAFARADLALEDAIDRRAAT